MAAGGDIVVVVVISINLLPAQFAICFSGCWVWGTGCEKTRASEPEEVIFGEMFDAIRFCTSHYRSRAAIQCSQSYEMEDRMNA